MDIIGVIKNFIIQRAGGKKLGESPYNQRLTFINNDDEIRRCRISEYKTWYSGDSDELNNFYLNAMIRDFNLDPIYNRNRRQYFWAVSESEGGFKKVHSGIPRAIIDTLVNVIGPANIECESEEYKKELDEELNVNSFRTLVNTREEPLTMVCGCGAFKVSAIPGMKHMLIQYYDADDVEFAVANGEFVGAIYKDYYSDDDGKKYTLLEKRRVEENKSIIEYELFKMNGRGEGEKVPLTDLKQTENLQRIEIDGIDEALVEPCLFFDDPLHPYKGRSMFQGKCDLFDDLDQSLSISSKTSKLSTPIDYIPIECLQTGPKGEMRKPNSYNRDYILINTPQNMLGDPTAGAGKIQTTQAQLNFEQYDNEQKSKLNMILTGIMSPCSLGVDLKSRDNSDAQREKEKVTIMTRDNIIEAQRKILQTLARHVIIMKKYMESPDGKFKIDDIPQFSVKFREFANPSFENRLSTLGAAWSNGMISTKIYVDMLWGDTIPESEKQSEMERLEAQRKEGTSKQTNPSDINRNWQSESPSYHNDDKKEV